MFGIFPFPFDFTHIYLQLLNSVQYLSNKMNINIFLNHFPIKKAELKNQFCPMKGMI